MLLALQIALLLVLLLPIFLRARRSRALRHYANAIRLRNPLWALFVSKLDRRYVGVSLNGEALVLGDPDFETVYPFAEVRGAEVLRDVEKGRLRGLKVRISLDDPARPSHDYLIFDAGRWRGLKADGGEARAMIDQAERLRDLVQDGMARAA
ncbi:MAG: hypothetical protein KF842_10400 [Caulobacter sp.]|nr:hypothetical protein [Caulobacter sp.]